MNKDNILKDKTVLVVDDEPDVLDTVEEELEMCRVHKAADYAGALEKIRSTTYDLVILDIMGVNGFELLKMSSKRGFPTVILTAHALSSEAFKESARLGAAAFIPKEKIGDLTGFIEDVLEDRGRPVWQKVLDRLGNFFEDRFGPGWIDKDEFFRSFEKEVRDQEKPR